MLVSAGAVPAAAGSGTATSDDLKASMQVVYGLAGVYFTSLRTPVCGLHQGRALTSNRQQHEVVVCLACMAAGRRAEQASHPSRPCAPRRGRAP